MTGGPLSAFAREALIAGRPRDEIDAAMAAAGWPAHDRGLALADWHDMPGGPPVPRPRPGFDLAEFLLALFRYGILSILAWQGVEVAHALIDVGMPPGDDPEAADWAFSSALYSFRWAVATTVVLAPVFAWLVLRDARSLRAEPMLRRAPARRLPAITVMAAAAAVFLSALVGIVYGFLTGDARLPALLRSLAVIAAAATVFLLTRRDLRER